MGAVTGSFTATGQSSEFVVAVPANREVGRFNVFLSGTGVGSVQLERSPDEGATWYPVTAGGVQMYAWSYSNAGSTSSNVSETCEEPEADMQYRLNCTAYTSGAISYRISQ